jgi:gas vesicle protein
MNTRREHVEYADSAGHAKSLFTGLLIGGLVGAGTILLMAPQSGEKTRAELQQGVDQLKDRTTETVKDTISQVKSKTYEIKDGVQSKAGEIQSQGKDILAKQLGRVAEMAGAGKRAVENS